MNDPYPNRNGERPAPEVPDRIIPDTDLAVEQLIGSLQLRDPSADCDEKIFSELNHGPASNSVASAKDNSTTSKRHSPAGILISVLSTAAALLIGFMLGNLANRNSPHTTSLNSDAVNQQLAGFELSENVSVVEGESRTVIVGDSIQMQNDVPVRKLETMTLKKVIVKDANEQDEKEIDIPIWKVFYTLAETI